MQTIPERARPGDVLSSLDGGAKYLMVAVPGAGNFLAKLGRYEDGGGSVRRVLDVFKLGEKVNVEPSTY